MWWLPGQQWTLCWNINTVHACTGACRSFPGWPGPFHALFILHMCGTFPWFILWFCPVSGMSELVCRRRDVKRDPRSFRPLWNSFSTAFWFVFRGCTYVTVHPWLIDYVMDLRGCYSSYLNGIRRERWFKKNVGEAFLVDPPPIAANPPPPPPLAAPVTVLSHDCTHMTSTHLGSTKLYVCVEGFFVSIAIVGICWYWSYCEWFVPPDSCVGE